MNSLNPQVLTTGLSHFVGFHDLTPWNIATDELICLRTETREDHIPIHEDEAGVVILSESGEDEAVIGTTQAWNWQKGARQRWLPALGRRVVAWNVATADGFACRIHDLEAGTERAIPYALYDICDHAGFGLSLDFRRLYTHQPGYGYDHPGFVEPIDGIVRVELHSGEARTILSLGDFLAKQQLSPLLGDHYFTHIQISPDGRRYVFMHRCFLASGGLINHLVVGETDGSGFRVILDDKMSHFDWADNDHILVWGRKNAAIRRLKESKLLVVARALYRLSRKIRVNAVRQGLYNECFRLIDVRDGTTRDIGKGVLTEDGHPQVNPVHPGLWVNDTYPDSSLRQTLMLYDLPSNRRVDLLRLQTQPSIKETGWRCDFHPRWKPDGSMVCFDSAHLGRRQICVLDVSALIPASP